MQLIAEMEEVVHLAVEMSEECTCLELVEAGYQAAPRVDNYGDLPAMLS